MNSNCRCIKASYAHGSDRKVSTLIRVGWILVALTASVVVPLRIAEIVAANHPSAIFCVAVPSYASAPTLAVSHADQNQGNLKSE